MLCVVLMVALSGTTDAIASTAAWRVVSSPNPDPAVNTLLGLARVPGSNELWAVGYHSTTPVALIEHWDGSTWTVVPAPPGNQDWLRAVTAVSATDAWAVGHHYDVATASQQPLIEHWDGAAWTAVPSPVAGTSGYLAGVAAVSANNVWAVGASSDGYLIEHWDGSAWSIEVSANPGWVLTAIARVPGRNELWAVGTPPGGGALNLHYLNGSWQAIAGPSVGLMFGVTAISRANVWAAGMTVSTPRQTVIQHWDGVRWSVVPSPNASDAENSIGAISASRARNVWAVGGYAPTNDTPRQTLTMRWTGSRWKIVPSPTPGVQGNLVGVVAIGRRDVWAAGTSAGTLTEHYSA